MSETQSRSGGAEKLLKMTLKFDNTEKGCKAKRVAQRMMNLHERYIVEELRRLGYSNHFSSEIYA